MMKANISLNNYAYFILSGKRFFIAEIVLLSDRKRYYVHFANKVSLVANLVINKCSAFETHDYSQDCVFMFALLSARNRPARIEMFLLDGPSRPLASVLGITS